MAALVVRRRRRRRRRRSWLRRPRRERLRRTLLLPRRRGRVSLLKSLAVARVRGGLWRRMTELGPDAQFGGSGGSFSV
jgi:hypothetical protein